LEEVVEFKSNIVCLICNELALPSRDPVYCMTCEIATFCKSCTDQWREKNNSCPQCREPRFKVKALKENLTLRTLTEIAIVFCKNASKGCKHVAPMSEIEDHEKYCGNCDLCDDFAYGMDIQEH